MLNWFWQAAKNESLLRSLAMTTASSRTREPLHKVRVSLILLGLTQRCAVVGTGRAAHSSAGGSPHRQIELYKILSLYAEVLSADGHMAQLMAINFARYWDGDWIQHPERRTGAMDLSRLLQQIVCQHSTGMEQAH